MDRTFLNPLPAEDVVLSIREHLTKLVNARQGSLIHLPDYGLPDLGEIYQKLPESLETLRFALNNLIYRYEPRIKNCTITFHPIQQTAYVIGLTLFCTLLNNEKNEKIAFEMNFLSSGIVILL